jgi:hypothetical protein
MSFELCYCSVSLEYGILTLSACRGTSHDSRHEGIHFGLDFPLNTNRKIYSIIKNMHEMNASEYIHNDMFCRISSDYISFGDSMFSVSATIPEEMKEKIGKLKADLEVFGE